MATVRSFEQNGQFVLTDLTQELLLIPNTWGLVNSLGIFSMQGVTQHSVTIESHDGSLSVITDQFRGDRNTVNKDDTRTLRSFPIPHFPLDDKITPQDLQGIRAYGNTDAAATEAEVTARKLERIRKNHAVTMEAARCQAITTGTIFAPNGTVAGNYYTEFGVTRFENDFTLGTATTDVVGQVEEVIAHIQDNVLTGDVVTEIVGLASPEFFQAFITHPKIVEAYQFYSSTQEPLRDRVGGQGLYRRFSYAGVTLIEYRGNYPGLAGNGRLIPAGDVYFMPRGVDDLFVTYCSPANKMGLVNTIGEESYVFSYRSPMDEGVILQSEHNALHLVRRPQAVVRGFTSN